MGEPRRLVGTDQLTEQVTVILDGPNGITQHSERIEVKANQMKAVIISAGRSHPELAKKMKKTAFGSGNYFTPCSSCGKPCRGVICHKCEVRQQGESTSSG